MKCPKCGRTVPEGFARCPACEDTGRIRVDPQRERKTPPVPPAELDRVALAGRNLVEAGPRAGGFARAESATLAQVAGQALGRWASGLEVEDSTVGRDADRLFAWLRALVLSLRQWDRRAFWGAVVVFLGSFSPWSYQRGLGLDAGIEDWGVATALLGVLAGACQLLRARGGPGVARLLYVQLGALVLVAALCTHRSVAFLQAGKLPAGVVLTGLAAAYALAAALAAFLRER